MPPDRCRRRLAVVTLLACLLTAAAAIGATPAAAAPAPQPGLVVKINLAGGYTINDVVRAFPVAVDSAVLASRGVYLLRPTDPRYLDPKKTHEIVDKVAHAKGVVYSEQNYAIQLSDTRFHAWPDGTPTDAGTDSGAWLNQPAAAALHLSVVHRTTTGARQTVAVLDTGADPRHPALAGRLAPGWDYIDDDDDPSEGGGAGVAFGHGTFVAGIVALVAPDARIRPYRVLDAAGNGTVFAVTEAILDAADSGATVINMSFGVSGKTESKLVSDAVKQARKRGALVVAAAGNDASTLQEFPAAQPEAVAVTALSAGGNGLAQFSNNGPWVDIAAPGVGIVGPVPGGQYATWAGTSMATPFVAGQTALLRSAFPGDDQPKLIDRLVKRADRVIPRCSFGAANPLASLTAR